MKSASAGTESQIDLDAKARVRKASKATAYSTASAQLGELGAVPCIRLSNMFACISCGYFGPAGVGTGLVTPSAVVPTMTKGASMGLLTNSLPDCL